MGGKIVKLEKCVKQLEADIEAGKVAHVIVKDMSRIGRDYLQTGFYTEVFFREHGVHFIAIANSVDSDDQNSNEFAPFLNIMNEWYLRDLRANKFVKGEMQFTDITNRDYFLKAFGDKIRFCVKYNKFLIWNGTCWEVDNDGYVEEDVVIARQRIKLKVSLYDDLIIDVADIFERVK